MARRRSTKLTEQFVGPYKIKTIISANVVKLELPRIVNISPVINISRIKQCIAQV